MIKYLRYCLFFTSIALGLCLNREDIYDNSWALVVGINNYQNVPKLNYAVEDAMAIKNMFINNYGFPRDNVRYLIDKEATQSNIKRELSLLLKKAGTNDRVVFYFAGHGETESLGLDEGDIGFLLPSDGDANDLYFTAIDMGELSRIAKYSKAKHMLFLVDACYGGLAALNTRSLSLNKSPNYLDKVIDENARQIITAGGKDEKVLEKDDWEHSAFTKNLLTALKDKKADQNSDGYITGSEIGFYLQENVSIDTDNYQNPQAKRLTTHEGEIIFLSDIRSKKKEKEELELTEMLQAMVMQMSQQSQNNQISINENQRVVKPGSIGLYSKDPTKEVQIESLFLRPSGLAYKGKFKLSIEATDELSWSRVVIIELNDVLEIPGETITGIYNFNTGNVD